MAKIRSTCLREAASAKAGEIRMGNQDTRKSVARVPGIRISGKVKE